MIGTPSTPPTVVRPIDFDRVRAACRVIEPITRVYFRSHVRGLERIPTGQTLLVTHHDGGALPIAAACFAAAWHAHFEFTRPLYALAHDIVRSALAPLGRAASDIGIIAADRSTMDAALATGASVLVMPGAAHESFRPHRDRARIDLGGRKGFVQQAIRWKIPVTPFVSAGGHDTVFVLARGERLARWMGIPKIVRSADVWPLQLGLPWGIWALPFLPPFPLPARITTEVLPPIDLAADEGRALTADDTQDPGVVQRSFDRVLAPMRRGVEGLYAEHKNAFFG